MLKSKAIELLGAGELAAAAEALGVSYQAVNKWPEVLPSRISDRVLGACLRHGIEVPTEVLLAGADKNTTPALTQQAQAATDSVAQGVAHA